MAIKKITEVDVAVQAKSDLNLLMTQTETVGGVQTVALRRIGSRNLNDALGNESKNNKVSVLTKNATHEQYPSAKAVVEAVTGLYPKFGVSGLGGSSSRLTRVWDAVGKNSSPGTDTVQAHSDFDAYYPFARKKCVGTWSASGGKAVFNVRAYYGDADYAEDGTIGDFVAIDVTPFYWYESDDKSIVGVSAGLQPGWDVHPICMDKDNHARPHTYVPAYELAIDSTGHAVSLPGFHPQYGSYKALWDAARTYGSGALSDCAIIEPTSFDHYNYLLMTIEFATQNMQEIMTGSCNLRYASSDLVQLDGAATNGVVLLGSTGDALVIGQTIYLSNSFDSTPPSTAGYNVVTAVKKCNADGTLNEAGSYRLAEFSGTPRAVTAGTTVVVSRPWVTGSTNTVLGHTGTPISNLNYKHPCKYRWFENPYENIAKCCLDLMNVRVEDQPGIVRLQWYYNPHLDPTVYYPSTVYKPDLADLEKPKNGWIKLGTETQAASYANGYIKELGADKEYPHVKIPVGTIGASSTTFFCDCAYLVFSPVVRAVRRRGFLRSGAAAGPCYVFAYNDPSHGYWAWGGGLFFIQ